MLEDRSKLKPFGAGAATANGCVVNGRLFSVLIIIYLQTKFARRYIL